MYVSFGYQLLDNGKVKLYTFAYQNHVEKLVQIAYLNKCGVKINRMQNLGIATKTQKELFYDYQESELET